MANTGCAHVAEQDTGLFGGNPCGLLQPGCNLPRKIGHFFVDPEFVASAVEWHNRRVADQNNCRGGGAGSDAFHDRHEIIPNLREVAPFDGLGAFRHQLAPCARNAGGAEQVSYVVQVVAARGDGDKPGFGADSVQLGPEEHLPAIEDMRGGRARATHVHQRQSGHPGQELRIAIGGSHAYERATRLSRTQAETCRERAAHGNIFSIRARVARSLIQQDKQDQGDQRQDYSGGKQQYSRDHPTPPTPRSSPSRDGE